VRDPKRIRKMLIALEGMWQDMPDMRLGQLIQNIYTVGAPGSGMPGPDLFYVEDDEFMKRLEQFKKQYT